MSIPAGALPALLAAMALAAKRAWAARDSFDFDGVLATEENESPPPLPRRGEPTNATGLAMSLLEDAASVQGCGPLRARQKCGRSHNFRATATRDFRDQTYGNALGEDACRSLCDLNRARCCEWDRKSATCRGVAGGDAELRNADEGWRAAMCEHAAARAQTPTGVDVAPSYSVTVEVNTEKGKSLGVTVRTRNDPVTEHYIAQVSSETEEGQTTLFGEQGLDLREGDLVVQVNGRSVTHHDHDQLTDLIKDALQRSGPLKFTLRRAYEVAVVNVAMKKGDKFGISIGRLPNGEHYIAEVFRRTTDGQETLWAEQRLDLRVGDIIVMVDRVSVTPKSREELVKIFQDALGGSERTTLKLYLKRQYHYVTVEVNTQQRGILGATFGTLTLEVRSAGTSDATGQATFSIAQATIHRIMDVVSTTVDGHRTLWYQQMLDLRVGDVVEKVNGVSVTHKSHDDMAALIREALGNPRAALKLSILRGSTFGK